MILGLVNPSEGEIEILGNKNHSHKILHRVESIIETPGFYDKLTAKDNLEIHRRMFGVTNKSYIEEALRLVGLDRYDISKKPVRKFSLGMKQRLALARALVHKPEILILDEPTNGLDSEGIKEIRDVLMDLSQNYGMTVLISSHILNEIQLMADTIGIIDKGVLVKEVNYSKVKNENRDYLSINVNNTKAASFILENKLKIEEYVVMNNNNIRIYEKIEESGLINKVLNENGIIVKELSFKINTLEDYFLRLVGGEKSA